VEPEVAHASTGEARSVPQCKELERSAPEFPAYAIGAAGLAASIASWKRYFAVAFTVS
jgi:hypothetical protein